MVHILDVAVNDTMAVFEKKKRPLYLKVYNKVIMYKLILMFEVCFKIMLRNLNPSSFLQSLMMKLFCKEINVKK